MNEAFECALSARLHWMEKRYLETLGFLTQAQAAHEQSLALVCQLAGNEAHTVESSQHYGATIPLILSDVPELAQEYRETYDYWIAEFEEWEAEEAARRKKKERELQAQDCIAREAWEEMGLPTPGELAAHLLTGESIRIEGHFLQYDRSDGYTWMDNPYGVPGALGGRPTPELARDFLVTVATGGMYGPEP
ncbi:hypothetical protein [Pseudomonas putida]|uniref:hypothetical protein n=1 Tax=Pseudomonas putida TaxID=303 RepID=UPI0037C83642